jgi:hypothetical protein
MECVYLFYVNFCIYIFLKIKKMLLLLSSVPSLLIALFEFSAERLLRPCSRVSLSPHRTRPGIGSSDAGRRLTPHTVLVPLVPAAGRRLTPAALFSRRPELRFLSPLFGHPHISPNRGTRAPDSEHPSINAARTTPRSHSIRPLRSLYEPSEKNRGGQTSLVPPRNKSHPVAPPLRTCGLDWSGCFISMVKP